MFSDLRAHRLLLVVGIAAFIVMGAGQSLYGPALPAFSRMYALGTGQAGLLISAHWVGCALGVGIMFLASHRVTPAHSCLMIGAGAGLVAAGIGWWPTLVGAFALGAGYGMATVMFNRRFLTTFGLRGPAMVSFVNAVFGIGAIGAPLVFVALGSQTVLAFAIITGLALITSLVALPLGPGVREGATANRPYRLAPGILVLGILAIGTEACLIGLGPVALIALGTSEAEAARLLSAFFVAFLVVRLLLAAFANLMAPQHLLTGALASAAILSLGAVLASPAVCFVLLGASTGLFFPPYFVCATQLMGDDPRVTPTIIAGGLVGGILSPFGMAMILQLAGDTIFFWVVAGVTGGAACFSAVYQRRLRHTSQGTA
jgi:hypothetical protein